MAAFTLTTEALSEQAQTAISALKTNGSSAVALIGLLAILDDMSLNATGAYAQAEMVAVEENRSNPKNDAMADWQDLAQAGKNCYDISDLLLHVTLRYVANEETALRALLNQQKH